MYFKLWIGGSIVCAALVAGAAGIETADVQRMRAWIFLIGGSISTVYVPPLSPSVRPLSPPLVRGRRCQCLIRGRDAGLIDSLAIASTALSFHLPSFVRAVHSSGASAEVVSRLAFYQELHFLRTVCRWIFGVCSMIQAADGITSAQRINKMDFWPDFLTVASLLSIFWALTISVVVSLNIPLSLGANRRKP